MGYLEFFWALSPLDLVRETFVHIHAWLSERTVDPDEAEFLADMNRKVDWNDDVEKDEFIGLMEYFHERSSSSEDLSWPEVVSLDRTWLWHILAVDVSPALRSMLMLSCYSLYTSEAVDLLTRVRAVHLIPRQ